MTRVVVGTALVVAAACVASSHFRATHRDARPVVCGDPWFEPFDEAPPESADPLEPPMPFAAVPVPEGLRLPDPPWPPEEPPDGPCDGDAQYDWMEPERERFPNVPIARCTHPGVFPGDRIQCARCGHVWPAGECPSCRSHPCRSRRR